MTQPQVHVDWEDEMVSITFYNEIRGCRDTGIILDFAEAKRLQQLLQAELGVPGDLPAPAKQERNTAGVTGRQARGKK